MLSRLELTTTALGLGMVCCQLSSVDLRMGSWAEESFVGHKEGAFWRPGQRADVLKWVADF